MGRTPTSGPAPRPYGRSAKSWTVPDRRIDVWANQTHKSASLTGLDSPLFGGTTIQDNDAPPTPVTQGVGSEPNGLLLPSVHDLTTTVEDLMYQSTEATLIAPRWESAPWYADAKAACASHEVLPHASKDREDMTTWALVAFHFSRKTNNATQAKPSLSR